jgi:hypothetical protein
VSMEADLVGHHHSGGAVVFGLFSCLEKLVSSSLGSLPSTTRSFVRPMGGESVQGHREQHP